MNVEQLAFLGQVFGFYKNQKLRLQTFQKKYLFLVNLEISFVVLTEKTT